MLLEHPLQIYIDSLDEPPLTTLTVPHNGGVQAWRTVSASIKRVTGKHKVFFQLTGEPGNPIANMEWFQLQPNQTEVTFHQGCTVQGGKNKAWFAEAVDAVGKADIVIMVCGVSP
ncbi:MAG: carbohydrate-binding protein [Phycisphaerae bacterium]